MADLRFAIRTLRKQPVFALAAVATLTLGIGASTTIFSVLYQVLLRPLPYRDANRLVWVYNTYASGERSAVAVPDYLDRKAGADAIADATLVTTRAVALTGGVEPEQLPALVVTPSFFTTFGRQPAVGRSFTDDEAQPGTNRVAVLMDALWRSRFNADPSVIGRDIAIDGAPWRVVGVMPRDFVLAFGDAEILLPFAFTPAQRSDQERGSEFSFMIARLAPGRTIDQFNQQLTRIVEQTLVRVPARAAYMRTSNFGGLAVPLRDRMVGDLRTPLYILQASVVVLLVIACANVANLLLMRTHRRGRELAIRSALGAAPGRLTRQLMVEGVVLSGIGAAGGMAVAGAAGQALIALSGRNLPLAPAAPVLWPVLLFAVGTAITTGALFGVAPVFGVLRGRQEEPLREAGRATAGKGALRLRRALVIGETALAVVLLVAAGLLIKSLRRVLTVDPGFSTQQVLTAQIALPGPRYPDAAAQRAFWTALLERLRQVPGVVDVGVTSMVPFSGAVSAGTYHLIARPDRAGEQPRHALQQLVGGDYFRALRIPVLNGRVFDERDGADRQRVAVVDELFVRRQFGGQSPVGELINFGGARNYEIIGVVGTINAGDLATPVPEERIYLSVQQVPSGTMGVVAKTSLPPPAIVAQLRAVVRGIDPLQPMADMRTLDEWLERSLQPRRAPTTLLMGFSVAALALAAIGIYGVLAFAVSERAREFGIRQALGADRRTILSSVLGEGLATAGVGIAIGAAAALAVTRYLQSMLFGVDRTDPVVFGGVCALLLTVASIACYLPARAATRVDPTVALRDS